MMVMMMMMMMMMMTTTTTTIQAHPTSRAAQPGDHFHDAAVSASVELYVGRGSASDGLLVPNAHVLQLQVMLLRSNASRARVASGCA